MPSSGPLSDAEVAQFIEDGYVRLRAAFSRPLADACVDFLWDRIERSEVRINPPSPVPERPIRRDDRSTWTEPKLILLFEPEAEPVRNAMGTSRLHAAYDQLAGADRWGGMFHNGARPRFPDDGVFDGDFGWHLDGGLLGEDGISINVGQGQRAFLVLALLNDCGPDDAPTLLRRGSHRAVAKLFADLGDPQLEWDDIVPRLDNLDQYEIVAATGDAGDAYLCHPLLVHSAQAHRGQNPRFAAQVGVSLVEPIKVHRPDGAYSPLEEAVRLGISGHSPA